MLVSMHLPTTVVPLDRNTAENNVESILRQHRRLPGLEAFEESFPMKISAPHADRYSANLKAETFLKSIKPEVVSLLITCEIHKKASVIKHSLSIVEPVVSGTLNMSLCQDSAGALVTMRKILQQIFIEQLQVVFADPPRQHQEHRHQLLDLCCPVTGVEGQLKRKNTERRLVLNYFCNSDLSSDEIVHYCTYSCCGSPEESLRHFCNEVTWSLLPCLCPRYSRKSWTGIDTCLDWVSILSGFWGLHEKVFVKYTGYVPKQPSAACGAEEPQVAYNLLLDGGDVDGGG